MSSLQDIVKVLSSACCLFGSCNDLAAVSIVVAGLLARSPATNLTLLFQAQLQNHPLTTQHSGMHDHMQTSFRLFMKLFYSRLLHTNGGVDRPRAGSFTVPSAAATLQRIEAHSLRKQ